MALYTPPPSSGPLNSSLPALLPHELVQACHFSTSLRMPQKPSEPITPPVSTKRTHLPSIRHFDTQSNDAYFLEQSILMDTSAAKLPHPDSEDDDNFSMSDEDEDDDVEISQQPMNHSSPEQDLSDWFPSSQYHSQQSSLHVAEKTCEMICYLWFATNSRASPPRRHPPYFVPQSNSSTASLQFCVSPNFVQFMQKVLETTQVSQSVIVLSLHYIYRLKERNRLTNGEAGSEFRVAVAALMMANKFVDDNTYTNKTWSDVSGIPLTEINKMEREILLGIDFSLYVDKTTYDSWLNLLKGLVMAKEEGCMQWRRSSCSQSRSRRLSRCPVPSNAWSSSHRSSSAYSPPRIRGSYRARSTSPPAQSFRYPFTFTAPTSSYTPTQFSQTPTKPGAKRSADDAFSPTSASFYTPSKPPKRQMGVPALSLSIPNTQASASNSSPNNQRKSNSPLDGLGLNHFSKLTLATNSPAVSIVREMDEPMWVSSQRQQVPPKTLSAPWALPDRERIWAAPQNLYYYSLTCSPAIEDNQPVQRSYGQEPISGAKKAKLRYHPAPQSLANPSPAATGTGSYRYAMSFDARPSNRMPMVVHSASASPSVREAWLDYRQQSQQHSRSQLPVPTSSAYSSHSPARLSVTSSGSTPSSVSVSTPSSAVGSQEIRTGVPVLPPFNELVSSADGINGVTHPPAYPFGVQSYDTPPMTDAQSQARYTIASGNIVDSCAMDTGAVDDEVQVVGDLTGLQAAPFANAGPPGVHHYGYGCNGQNGSWEFHPYLSAYTHGYGHMNMHQYAATTGWVRTR